MTERRFTDRDLALVLRRAVELERDGPGEAGRGLTLGELEEVALEAGISREAIRRAVAELDSRRGLEGASWFGPAGIRKSVQAVPTGLSRERLLELVRLVDERVASQGTLTEALGGVRWTGSDRFLSTQVSLEPGGAETVIRVSERFPDRFRRLVHVLPGAWGTMLGVIVVGAAGLSGLAVPVVLGGATAVGLAAGGAFWRTLSARSAARVHSLGRELAERAATVAPGPPDTAAREDPSAR